MKKIAITTTVPVEAIYAAGMVPVDLNNIFITGKEPMRQVEEAEIAGYPRNICGWIKGLYSTALALNDLEAVVAVTQGDCSNTHALMETLVLRGIRIIPFAFPYDRDPDLLRLQMEKLIEALGTTWTATDLWKKRLDETRRLVWQVDELTWKDNRVDSFHNHYFQVSCSDFNGDQEKFTAETQQYLDGLRPADEKKIRLGYIGVPPIIPDLYDYLEQNGARVVFNEIQRQFSMPGATTDLVEQYRNYTYPYPVFGRLEDIAREVKRRGIQGLIHYTQSFCFRQIEDMIFREKLKIPLLTLEGDKPSRLDARTKMRLEAFLDMLRSAA